VTLQKHINTPEAKAAAEAAATAAALKQNEAPVHEDNAWGIEVNAAETGQGPVVGHADGSKALHQALPAGVEFSMPAGGGVTATALEEEAVQDSGASLEDLTSQLMGLNASK